MIYLLVLLVNIDVRFVVLYNLTFHLPMIAVQFPAKPLAALNIYEPELRTYTVFAVGAGIELSPLTTYG